MRVGIHLPSLMKSDITYYTEISTTSWSPIAHKSCVAKRSKKPLIERQADRFAAALMMPRYILSDEVQRFSHKMPRTLGEALRLANYLKKESGFQNVSISALVNPVERSWVDSSLDPIPDRDSLAVFARMEPH